MTALTQNISKILDRMYNIRSQSRSIYLNCLNSDIYNLEDLIKLEIKSILKNKGEIEINIKLFSINININDDAQLSNRSIQNIYFKIDTILRNFIKEHTENKEILDYINNTYNSILDYFTVGNSIKFIL